MAALKTDLVDKITELARAHWAETSEALLLSKLGPLLAETYADYKSTLSGQSLRNFIRDEAPDLMIAQHSLQYAKVGVHPSDKSFSYDTEVVEEKAEPTQADKLKESRRAFYKFIEAISDFPAEDINDVQIPTSVIVRLLEGK